MYIPGSNNGTFGAGMSRGAVFSAQPGYFYQGFPLPQLIQHPAPTGASPYLGRAFGRKFGNMVYQLTPGGISTEEGWGFKNKVKSFGRKRRSRKGSRKGSKRRSRRRSRRSRKSHRGSRRSGKSLDLFRRLRAKRWEEVRQKRMFITNCQKCGHKIKTMRGAKTTECSKCGHVFYAG